MAGNWHRIGNISGRDGVGVPQGGAQGEALVKEGGTDYATSWRRLNYADIEGMVPAEDLPQISNEPYVIASQSAMLNLPAVPGRMAIRTDLGKTFVLAELPASKLENWVELKTTSDVQSVNGKTGNVTLTKADVGLGNVNNTADADKPEATTATRGLMPAADKAKLDGATAGATASRMVIRDSSGHASFRQVTLSDAPTANGHAATKAFVDDEVNRLIAGRASESGSAMATNWNNLGNISQAGVVEGFPTGAPAGAPRLVEADGDVTATAYDGFVKSPVWEIHHEALGLDYRKQTATLLSCDPDYMIGFTWERRYHPATGKWTAWTCTKGDTGIHKSFPNTRDRTRADVLCHGNPSHLYTPGSPFCARRTENAVSIWGAATTASDTRAERLASYDGMTIGWFSHESKFPMMRIWIPEPKSDVSPHVVSQGSAANRWLAQVDGNNIYGLRYGPAKPGTITWLPFFMSWPAPSVKTWESPWVSGD